ncbi:proteasome endopeptidase complex, archaeal, alpha subunit [Candidatus Micrarchaeota archaeon CG_4_10_14_0_2_um_filter_60_11]|nr:MAG: proteasome endopeptidase complex, archaeal, alpha subunit [Candidatus Micrarchaeota archaeon CG1_02_60_51]PIN96662.1 MAG: proteasome endopeptidase complex, archaeal, alpha subunit [Candidatus Micrarchaeota archaeon CG10_big_fil_rev_8_21_14_0_10_60_32]PIO02409.1 MAG: proteasome endopeptidase complex, archaeal, alpha subunit [Candidatus Micrarchaeota archaeon CG09_land_8_20_14_0_10_60_16]PIY91464.1 MAG: proteasome endopeptidase complex, archaeal, alpha subunit [Candidatus Micrarchaeota arc
MYPPSQAAYDRAITVFSPDGRLFQVEYAREAVRTGATSIGVVCRDGIVLVAHKRITSPLAVSASHEKIFQIDAHIAASSSGLVADARRLVDTARLEAQKHRLTYDEEIPIELLAKNIGDHIQFFTQYAGVRPYGVSLLIAGADGDLHLFETDPSGALFEYKACAIGSGKKAAEEFLKKEYKDGITTDEGVRLALKALRKVVEEKLDAGLVDIAVISAGEKRVHALSEAEISKALSEK